MLVAGHLRAQPAEASPGHMHALVSDVVRLTCVELYSMVTHWCLVMMIMNIALQ